MYTNAFIGKTTAPAPEELAQILGRAQKLWDTLIADLARDHHIEPEDWNSYSPKAGWSLPLRFKKRRIVYLGAMKGGFLASFVLGDKAIAAAKADGIEIPEGKRYAEGTPARFEVHKAADLALVKKVAAIKLAN
jgi:hypothetical protein